jgi:hypothetical protein
MKAEFMDDTGHQIPVEFEEGGFFSRWLNKFLGRSE